MVKKITCVSGEVTLCDDQDYPLLSRFTWYMGSNLKVGGYPCCFIYKKNREYTRIFMHQLVGGGAITIDHIDQNKLNNQSSNLRPATSQQNGWNIGKRARCRHGIPKSQYKGVIPYKSKSFGDGWQSIIRLTKKHERPIIQVRLGPFKTELEAAIAYNTEVIKHRGEYAWLNPIANTN